ncbi:Hsp20/alpha crystallin family protein [Pseudonocardiaceae bacterium YIM PH 21723]|nr:Hsp20/alpha crystallin family protein [Pseudonocardiaceae bacterium YIM PH 21723]
MLMRTDTRDLDRVASTLLRGGNGTWSSPATIPLDAYRSGDQYVVCLDLPGVEPEAIDLEVQRNMLTIKAERRPQLVGDDVRVQVSERPQGAFHRQLFLADSLDAEQITADYQDGVLTVTIPVADKAKPRRIAISGKRQQIEA